VSGTRKEFWDWDGFLSVLFAVLVLGVFVVLPIAGRVIQAPQAFAEGRP
jgi:hypothetical protein